MQFISAKPLLEQFKQETFQESAVGPYFVAWALINSIVLALSYTGSDPWSIASSVVGIFITLFGVFYLKQQNQQSFGNQFIYKYFSLGWVITVRMMLLIVPIAIFAVGLVAIIGEEEAVSPIFAIIGIAYHILFYWWLGKHFRKSFEYEF